MMDDITYKSNLRYIKEKVKTMQKKKKNITMF